MKEKAILQRGILKGLIIRGINKIIPGYLENVNYYGKRIVIDGDIYWLLQTDEYSGKEDYLADG